MSRPAIELYAVIGAGNMGSGIAQKVATEGMPVVLVDVDQARVDAGLARIEKMLEEGVARRIFTADRAAAVRARVTGSSDWSALADAGLVIEAVFEDLAVKRDVFRRLDEACPDAILATNTSSFYVRDVAAATKHPERVLGLHYFYHPAKNRLVEVVGHAGTDAAAFEAAWAAQEVIGKTPIRSADAPGFVVNRYFVPWLNEAVRLLEAGIADIATIDAAAKKTFAIGMGPFELMNVTGVPIALHAATTLGRELGPFYAPAAALAAQVASGKDWDLAGTVDETRHAVVADRLLGVVVMVAAQLVSDGVGTVEETDIGARVGLRWSRGPFELANDLGMDRARALVEAVAKPFDLPLPAVLAQAPSGGIPIRLVAAHKRGRLASVWIQRPDAMNALNDAVVGQLAAALADAPAAPGLVLGGSGKAFVAGADIKFFVEQLKRDGIDEIERFTAAGAQVLAGLSGGSRPVVARVHGLSLGGGSELALACDHVACSPKGSFGFPETGLGIYPGLGGIPRLARRIGTPLARFFVYTGSPIDARTALALGVCDAVATFDGLDTACEKLAAKGPVAERTLPGPEAPEAWQPVARFFGAHRVGEILTGRADTGGDPRLEQAVKRMGFKSAHALLLCERLFDEGDHLSLADALALDLRNLHEVFAHPDAMEGLCAMLEGNRPSFRPFA